MKQAFIDDWLWLKMLGCIIVSCIVFYFVTKD